jgi:hypothetical protein
MAAIIYLDVDDEITSAAARIRNAGETKIALVLPPGSRLATSRINFRLLAREALERNRVLSIVAADPAARAIAGSAGLPVHATVAEFEAATAPSPPEESAAPPEPMPESPPIEPAPPGDAPPPKRSRRRAGAAVVAGGAAAGAAAGSAAAAASGTAGAAGTAGKAAVPAAAAGTPGRGSAQQLSAELVAAPDEPPGSVAPSPSPEMAPPPSPPPSETRARSGAATIPVMPTTRTRPGLPGGLVAAFGALLVALLILAVAGYLVLPQATVVVSPVAVPVGPVEFTVRADPDAASVDPVGGVIPATRLSNDFTASGEFPATGKRVVQAKAKGTLRWRNCDPVRSYTIPAGTVAKTGSGIGFETLAAVFLPVATLTGDPPKLTCQAREVAARAVRAGPSGNVGPGTVTVVPSSFNSIVIKVSNPAAMTGGKRDEFTKVQQSDIDAALASLTKDLNAQFDAWTAAPDDLPAGATAFPATGQLGTPVPSVDPGTLIDVEEPTFQLATTATGTVVAVDPSQVDQVAADRISGNVPANHSLQEGSITSSHDGGQADGDLIDFRVTASAAAVPVLDAGALRDEIKGKSVDEARKLLERYGTVTIATWPGFVSSIPTLDFRLDLSVADGTDAPATSRPSPSLVPSGSAP